MRRAERDLPGLQAAVARRERQGATPLEALGAFAVDPDEKWSQRHFVADLLWKTPGAQDARRLMRALVATSKKSNVQAEYLRLCSSRTNIHPIELGFFQEVLAHGSPEEQMTAIDGLAFIDQRAARRALVEALDDTGAPLEVRERAAEMLHLHASREATEACVRALGDPNAGIRFWAAYTLGNSFLGKGLREIAASALENVLDDENVAPGWWSVGREAQAMIVGLRNDPGARERLQAEIQRVQQDENASAEDKRWAECYVN